MPNPHVNDWGTSYVLKIYGANNEILDISTASPINIIFTRPDGTGFSREASLVTDGTDGKMEYTTAASELNVAGDWSYYGTVQFLNGYWATTSVAFIVEANP
jgi:hypothetical protein